MRDDKDKNLLVESPHETVLYSHSRLQYQYHFSKDIRQRNGKKVETEKKIMESITKIMFVRGD
jgi:hypothetical protein